MSHAVSRGASRRASSLATAIGLAIAGLAIATAPALAQRQQPPVEWDGLMLVDSDRFDVAYLAPGVDFSVYTKVMIDPTQAAFKKDWVRDYNRDAQLSARISDDEALEALTMIQSGFEEVFAQAYRDAGYEVVTTPAPDVLRLATGVVNITVSAPDRMTPSRSMSFAGEAGQAALILEARDSMSGALLGRGVDQREIGDNQFAMRRTSVSNRFDFEQAFEAWADMSADALGKLRSLPAPAVPAAVN